MDNRWKGVSWDKIEALSAKLIHRSNQLQFSDTQQLAFLEDLSTLISDGITPAKAISSMRRFMKPPASVMASDLEQAMKEGKSLAEGMQGWFSPRIVAAIDAGEQGGILAECVRQTVEHLHQGKELKGALIAELAYPFLLLGAMGGVFYLLDKEFFPVISAVVPPERWGAEHWFLANLCAAVSDGWYWILLALISIVIGIRRMFGSLTGQVRNLIERWPLFSQYRQLIAAEVMQTIGLLAASGLSFKQILLTLEESATPYLKMHLQRMRTALADGQPRLAEVMNSGLFNEQTVVRLNLLSESGSFNRALIIQGKTKF